MKYFPGLVFFGLLFCLPFINAQYGEAVCSSCAEVDSTSGIVNISNYRKLVLMLFLCL